MLDLKSNQWEQLNLKGCPSPRSGHRMVCFLEPHHQQFNYCIVQHYFVVSTTQREISLSIMFFFAVMLSKCFISSLKYLRECLYAFAYEVKRDMF